MEVKIRNKKYRVIKDYGETINTINLDELVTDYYDNFDYIVGDWAYGKLRLKGFYNHNNKFVKSYNDIDKVEDYINNNCAYGCKHFILKKMENKTIEKDA
ncbi:MAG: DUF1027 domain-containing protein [Firmicutes bacterium]|nr:DUF1027 domain-containing protein [Bacillota bacterium]